MGYRVGNGTVNGSVQTRTAQDHGRFLSSYHAHFSPATCSPSRRGLATSASAGLLRPEGSCSAPGAHATIAPGHVPIQKGEVQGRSTRTGLLPFLPKPAVAAHTPTATGTGPSSTASNVTSVAGGGLKQIDPEARRRTLELLADPDLDGIAKEIFVAHDANKSGKLGLNELQEVLRTLARELDLPAPEATAAESLFKKYDVNNDNELAFNEFMQLLRALLRRSAFDHSTILRREFFVNRSTENIWNNYEKKKELGHGTFGKAYLVKSKQGKDERVVKAVHKTRTSLPLDDIEQEILIMRQVDHPHVVRLFEWYEDGTSIYLVLEALKGGTLKDVLLGRQEQKKSLKEDWVRKVIKQSCGGMAYCHSLRLVHKDLKDENIMLLRKDPSFEEPYAVIIDLGIAEMFSSADPVGRKIGGTPATMAPEVWKGVFGPKCDVWSMGVIMFELLSGTYPFMANSFSANAWRRLHKRGPQWSRVTASKAGLDLCKSMLMYYEIERPTMKEVSSHEWFRLEAGQLSVVSPRQFQDFITYNKQQQLQRSMLLEIASRLPMSRSAEIVRLFESVDSDVDGRLSENELEVFLDNLGIANAALVKDMFKALDVDGDGSLTFTEFAAGALLLFKEKLEGELYNIFQHHDGGGQGELTASEAKQFLGSVSSAMQLEGDRFQELDKLVDKLLRESGRKTVSWKDLKEYLLEAPPVSRAPSPMAPQPNFGPMATGSRRSSARSIGSRASSLPQLIGTPAPRK